MKYNVSTLILLFNYQIDDLFIGCSVFGILHTENDPPMTLEKQFSIAAESEAFDYLEKTPPLEEIDEYQPRLFLLT